MTSRTRVTIREGDNEAFIRTRMPVHAFTLLVLLVAESAAVFALILSVRGFFERGHDWFVLVFSVVLFSGVVAGLLFFLWIIFGEEKVWAAEDTVRVRRGMPAAGRTRTYSVADIQRIRTNPEAKSGRASLCLLTSGGAVDIGLDMTLAEAREAARLLSQKTGIAVAEEDAS